MKLLKGEGIAKNPSEAARYFKLAADRGLREAQYNYGVGLQTGEVVPKDLRLAAEYSKKAADQGHANAKSGYERVQKQLRH
jgi:TPR repeat protein